MKKRVLVVFLIAFVILNLSFMFAQGNESQVKSAYSCLEGKVEEKCGSLTFEQQIFSLLAIGECADEIMDDSDYMSNTKQTAQAILALSRANKNTEDAEDWLMSQTEVPTGMDWLLQIDSTESTGCSVTGDSGSTDLTVNADKTITLLGTSSCFSLYGNDYWLRISPSCYSQEFTISCDQPFSTNLIYKKTDEDTLYISGDTSRSSAGGTTTEQVDSLCFTQGGCNYEASLWSALVLNFRGHEISSYLPYLITMKNEPENEQYLPEAFLYSLTGDFKGELLLKSKTLPVSSNKYYDTALAFLPFQKETIEEKTSAMSWLLGEAQGSDGCWNGGNVRDTAFILYSLWPRALSISGDEGPDCENTGYYCMSRMSCADAQGDVLEDYSGCFGLGFICCTSPRPLENCVEQGGEICSAGETCTISETEALDTTTCCLGSCRTSGGESECESYASGSCRASCYSNEEESNYACDSGQICCVEKTTTQKSYWWIWILLGLIFLVVLGIIFKEKLRPLWIKIKSQFGKGKGKSSPPSHGPRFPPLRPGVPPQAPMSRKILPPAQKGPLKKSSSQKGDIDEVLKKLKEMGK